MASFAVLNGTTATKGIEISSSMMQLLSAKPPIIRVGGKKVSEERPGGNCA
jgi:hypothetical protein